jgi:hypothetical protein
VSGTPPRCGALHWQGASGHDVGNGLTTLASSKGVNAIAQFRPDTATWAISNHPIPAAGICCADADELWKLSKLNKNVWSVPSLGIQLLVPISYSTRIPTPMQDVLIKRVYKSRIAERRAVTSDKFTAAYESACYIPERYICV